jgi:hypothetical protein
MTEKHTPGPWSIWRDFNVIADKGTRAIANCGGFSNSRNAEADHEENVANARLIAAAPDLLEALKEMVRLELLLETYGPLDRACNMARAAILKATGGELS